MSSGNYSISTDSINFAGNRSNSSTYYVDDTVGEIATGRSSSSNKINNAGYQQTSATNSTSNNSSTTDSVSSSSGQMRRIDITYTDIINESPILNTNPESPMEVYFQNTDPLRDIQIIDVKDVDPMIKVLDISDFNFIQQDKNIVQNDGVVVIDGKSNSYSLQNFWNLYIWQ